MQSVRTSPAVLAKNPVLATVPKTRLVPRPAGTPNYPALSTAIYTNINAALAGLHLAIRGHGGRPVPGQQRCSAARRAACESGPLTPGAGSAKRPAPGTGSSTDGAAAGDHGQGV